MQQESTWLAHVFWPTARRKTTSNLVN